MQAGIQTEVTMKKRNKKHTNDTSENTTEKNWRSKPRSKGLKTSSQGTPEDEIHSSPVNDLFTTPLLTGGMATEAEYVLQHARINGKQTLLPKQDEEVINTK
jgi:hypothetical protein